MGDVVGILQNSPHISGNAKCLSCSHEWVAVAPTGTHELECPECKTWKGVFNGYTAPEEVWECDCGNQHFYISEGSAMCPRCGLLQRW